MKIHSDGIAELFTQKSVDMPQRNRLDWEKQWLSQNKSAFDVIENGGTQHDHATMDQRYRNDEKLAAATSPNEPIIVENNDAAHYQTAVDERAHTANANMYAHIKRVSLHGNFFESANYVQSSRQENVTIVSSMPHADVDDLYRRHELRQFALWRDGNNVAAAMRLPKSLEEDKGVLMTLRQWLADAGLKLLSLKINGKLRWKS